MYFVSVRKGHFLLYIDKFVLSIPFLKKFPKIFQRIFLSKNNLCPSSILRYFSKFFYIISCLSNVVNSFIKELKEKFNNLMFLFYNYENMRLGYFFSISLHRHSFSIIVISKPYSIYCFLQFHYYNRKKRNCYSINPLCFV